MRRVRPRRDNENCMMIMKVSLCEGRERSSEGKKERDPEVE